MPRRGPRSGGTTLPANTVQRLTSILKSARDIMRKDKGLSGELDRLPLLTWLLFLKFLDDSERIKEEEAELAGEAYTPLIASPYRWRDWAARDSGMTGPELLAFVNQEEAVVPGGERGIGLLTFLRRLQSETGAGRQDVVANVFKGVINRMESGYLLREVVDKLNDVHFDSSDEVHTLSRLYESMLREMRDAAGDSGEFYTPRPVVEFMVKATDPRLGEVVLDPAAGTGGFLVESFQHLARQAKTVEERRVLQEQSIEGQEAKPLPYMLLQMNLLLHGLDYPTVAYGNTLNRKLTEIGDRDRVDVILTNPPFGGEEEASIRHNFPPDLQTSETALLFLQVIMRRLRRKAGGRRAGRAGVVVPDGILSQEGVAARVRERLVSDFRLRFVIKLPRGVFEPYTKSSTSILFFDADGVSDKVWFYEVPVREGIKAYSQTNPFKFDEMLPVLEWMTEPVESEHGWTVDVEVLKESGYWLVQQNPRDASGLHFSDPGRSLEDAGRRVQALSDRLLAEIADWQAVESALASAERIPLGKLVQQVKREEVLLDDEDYHVLAMAWYAKGLYVKHVKSGAEIKAEKLFRVQQGDFVYNRLFAWKGSFAEVREDVAECVVSGEFPTFEITDSRVRPGFLWAYFAQPKLWDFIESLSTGTTSTSRLRLKEARFLRFEVPLPGRDVQEALARLWQSSLAFERELRALNETHPHIAQGALERAAPWATAVEEGTPRTARRLPDGASAQPEVPALAAN
ncbi:MAG: HsdM family class I SAM-dependent methyltransferase [Acidimicrobiales bacterium]